MLRALPIVFAMLPSAVGYAQPQDWTWEEADEDVAVQARKRFRFSSHFNVWIASFERPPRACRSTLQGANRLELRSQQIPGFGGLCSNQDSEELAYGAGVQFAFRTLGPVYLTGGLDFVYTDPDFSVIKNQLVVGLPFGVMVTWYEWVFRPIAYFRLTPVLYVTDDSRDYTWGGGAGVAVRILSFGSISLMAGYHYAETMNTVSVEMGVHPIF